MSAAADAFMGIFGLKRLGTVVATYWLPIKLESTANARWHWRKKAAHARQQRQTARLIVMPVELPILVLITRVGPRKLDSDNLAISAKHVRDGIADVLGVDDGDETKVRWEYAQEKGKGYGCRVEYVRVAP